MFSLPGPLIQDLVEAAFEVLLPGARTRWVTSPVPASEIRSKINGDVAPVTCFVWGGKCINGDGCNGHCND